MVLVILVVMLLAAAAVAAYGAMVYNGLIALKNNIDKAWANIDVLLKQRHDELTKLLGACQGYMTHEKGVFERISKAREALMSAQGPQMKGEADGELRGAMKQLFALAENYPDLKAQASFQQLQGRITGIESEIADRREFYNDSANTYNIRIASIPDMIFARMLGFGPHELFKVAESDREDVKVEFPAN